MYANTEPQPVLDLEKIQGYNALVDIRGRQVAVNLDFYRSTTDPAKFYLKRNGLDTPVLITHPGGPRIQLHPEVPKEGGFSFSRRNIAAVLGEGFEARTGMSVTSQDIEERHSEEIDGLVKEFLDAI